MNIRELKEFIKDLPDDMKVYCNPESFTNYKEAELSAMDNNLYIE